MQYKIDITVGYDTEKEMNEAYARMKGEAVKAVPCKSGGTKFQKHLCYNDDKLNPQRCVILENDIEAVNTISAVMEK